MRLRALLIGLALGTLGVLINKNNNRTVAGIIMYAIAIGIGGIRLTIGFGIF